MREILNMTDIWKHYPMGDDRELAALQGVDLRIVEGEFVAVLGPSGSGKSTLMNIIGCLDTPTRGAYVLSGEDVGELDEKSLSRIRNREIGFIFQSFQLLPRLTSWENVELPMIYAGVPAHDRKRRAIDILERMGIGDKWRNYPNQLSGGEQQRVAVARAVVTEPSILLADEPTGSLDQKTGQAIIRLFEELNQEGRTIIMITHDIHIARHARRVVSLLDGHLSEGETADV